MASISWVDRTMSVNMNVRVSARGSSASAAWAGAALACRFQRGSPVHGGDGLELVGRGAGPVEVPRGQRDVHLSRQEVASGEPVAGFVGERAPDRRAGGLHLALRQAEKRQAGLRVPAHLVRLPERL